MLNLPSEQAHRPYARTLGAILTFLAVGLFVKASELRLTYELARRDVWTALRFSWQEFLVASLLIAVVLVWQWRVPVPGRAVRAALAGVRILLAFGAIVSVLGIKYYGMYHGHMTVTDFEQIGWALKIASSIDVFESWSIRAGVAIGVLLIGGIPWLCSRLRPRAAARLGVLAFAATTATGVVTWTVGRPHLNEAQLEPSPLVWFFWGPRATYLDVPDVETLAPIGDRRRREAVNERPRNVILVVLESIPAHALAGYDPTAPGGRRLYTEFGGEITQFDQVFAVTPISDSGLISAFTGRSPFPTNSDALAATEGAPSLAEILKRRGFQTHFLLNAPTNPLIDRLASRGFDRALHMDSDWPRKTKYVRHQWGYDDRLLFDEARDFLSAQGPDAAPFLMVLYTNNAHYPYPANVIPGLNDHPDQKVRHTQLVGHVLDQLTDLYASLKESGLADTTAVLAYGDHGQAFGEHPGNYVHSKELYWENMHVPMLLLHPRRLGLPSRITQLGSLDDVMPTVFDFLGIEPAAGSGMSLLFDAPDRVIFMSTPFGPGVIGFRDRRFFYSLSRTGRELLFDRVADPREQRNVLDRYPGVAAAFRARLNK